ncbi:fumarylacetoacetate hydrolase family protein [Mucilaginibacter auburnensis]|uniref:2-dehydro-3-deoxy-D-arabinonate dehydratase n=1 Tax=Mucilaginibacter auburnensis TaxID=1457233 RepID=A0A2H9VQQ4_9SPHI|nr:fumarylacetoacetate hydrolase family protein [Mucilaginibacter auburnensis]PJJ83145.1 2-dehydro-3-deoxy-D-arabinonate dehydratase [Mucilaginibacter auburnensis]
MKIYNTKRGIVIDNEGQYFLSTETNWDTFINRQGLYATVLAEIGSLTADSSLADAITGEVLAPLANQEVWASGVTYFRSRTARIEESKDAGGGTFYDRVYNADRPELFFKAPAYRTVGTGADVRIRKDSKWNVPEPELTLFMCSAGTIEGYTIGNDMSSRDIEGENPLYLPQAKSYTGSAAVGPCIFVSEEPINPEATITLEIKRGGEVAFTESIAISQMKRKHSELAEWLFKELDFKYGVFLMTGTGIIPADEFSLQVGDVVNISIEGIGTLSNTVTS